ncbi:MAG: penicillin acylase family protein, partial [bacterium]
MIHRIVIITILLGIIVLPLPASGGGISKAQSIKFPELKGSVTIHRDEYGTPYIIAENEHDLFFAHGYIQAVDRLFQLDGIRRIPKGETAEIIGRDQLGMDIWFKKIGLDVSARDSLEILSEETKFMLKAYTDGVNAFIENNKSTLPLEFKLLGYEPEPWTPLDSLCVMRLIGWWLSVGMYQEMYYDDLIDTYGEEIASELFPGIPLREEIDKSVKKKKKTKKVFRPTPWRNYNKMPPRGTNCWVVSGSKTKSGHPILANDPHLELFSPAIWYEVGLSCPEWTVTGVVFPGLPIPQIGTNGKIAWGAASFPADVQDLYSEEINPDNEHQYKYDGKW